MRFPDHGELWRIRVAGLITLYAPPFHMAWTDAVVAMLLVATGVAGVVIAAVIHGLPAAPGDLWRFYAISGLGGIWLALDETFSVHEAIGFAIEGAFGIPPPFRTSDDAVFAAYGVVAIAFAWLFRRIAFEPGWPRQLVVIGLALTLALIAADALDVPGEEYAEVILGLFVLGAYLTLARRHVTRELARAGLLGHNAL